MEGKSGMNTGMAETKAKNRSINYQFRVLYAIGMVLVVANHCAGGPISLFYEFFPAYSFHIGLFVFCSGYFYKEKEEEHVGKYILKKLKSLILPLYLWNCFYALFAQVMSAEGFSFGVGITWEKLVLLPITDGHQFTYNLATWFVAPLFMAEVLNILYRKGLCFLKGNAKEIVYIVGALGMGMLGIGLSSRGMNTGAWLVMTRLLYFIPFYCAGYFYKKILEKHDHLSNTVYFAIVLAATLAMIVINKGTMTWEQAWSRYPEFSTWPYVAGFLGIAFWLRVSRILEPAIGRSRTVNLIAGNTYAIMANQMAGFMLVKAACAWIFLHTNHFQDFNWMAYHNDIWDFYLPGGIYQTRLIYVVVAIGLPILIQLGLNKVKPIIFGKTSEKRTFLRTAIVYVLVIAITLIPAKMISDSVANNGGVAVPRINDYPLGKVLYFDKENNNVDRYCVSGFSGHEDEFTWTDGLEAEISFGIGASIKKDLMLTFACGTYGPAQSIQIFANDNLIQEMTIQGTDNRSVRIPSEYITGDQLKIVFSLPQAASPSSNGESNDTRLLALSFRTMVLEEAE